MRILHILDHSLPLQSGYVYRTLGIVNQQRALGWEPVLLTSGKQGSDPLPRREKRRLGHCFEGSPLALEGRERRQGFMAELDVAGHARPLARRLFRHKTTLKVYQAP